MWRIQLPSASSRRRYHRPAASKAPSPDWDRSYRLNIVKPFKIRLGEAPQDEILQVRFFSFPVSFHESFDGLGYQFCDDLVADLGQVIL